MLVKNKASRQRVQNVQMESLVVVRHQATAPLGIVEEVLEHEGVPWRYHDCWTVDPLPAASDMSGLVVLGGAMNADEVEAYPYLVGVRELMREAVDLGLPVLGICLGAQILARALGAEVYRAPKRELGFVPVRATGVGDDILAPFAPASRVFQFHEDACALPEGAELLFTGDEIEVQAFRWGARAYGVQFHFEVTVREIDAWCDEVDDLEGEWGLTKEEVLEQASSMLGDQQRAGQEVAGCFARLVEDSAG